MDAELASATNLQQLSLKSNSITFVSPGAIPSNVIYLLVSSFSLPLSNCCMIDLCFLFFRDLSFNLLTRIQRGAFTNLADAALDLSRNRIVEIEIGAFSPSIKVLLLREMSIKRFHPDCIPRSIVRMLVAINFEHSEEGRTKNEEEIKPV